jgi:hypothetical protein
MTITEVSLDHPLTPIFLPFDTLLTLSPSVLAVQSGAPYVCPVAANRRHGKLLATTVADAGFGE